MGTIPRMGSSRSEAGYTLVEVLVVVGLIAVVVATLGAFFLGGPSPAVASAARDLTAAFGEARETAAALGEATLVFAPVGTGYSARVYRQMPGDAQFQAVNGPTYDSTVALTETAAPLGSPGFAFRIDSRGSVTGYQHFNQDGGTFTERSCPAAGAFVLSLADGRQTREVIVPCVLSVSAVAAAAVTVTPAPGTTAGPYAAGSCGTAAVCATSLPTIDPTCPPGYTADATQADVCDAPSPTPAASAVASPVASATATSPATATASASSTPGGSQNVTVCDVPGDANYDPRSGQTIAGIQYVGSTTTPPCAGSLSSPAPSPTPAATSTPSVIALSNFFVGTGSTTIRSTCNGVASTVTSAYAALAGVYPNPNSQTPRLGDSLTLPADGASVALAGTYTYGACNSAGPTTYVFVPFDIESGAFNASLSSRFMGDIADYCAAYWTGCVATTSGGLGGEDVPVLSIALLVERMAAQWSSAPSPNYVLYGNAVTNQYGGGTNGTPLSNLSDWILTTIDP